MTSNGSALESEPPRSKRGATGQSTPVSPRSPSASRSSRTAGRCWRATSARSAARGCSLHDCGAVHLAEWVADQFETLVVWPAEVQRRAAHLLERHTGGVELAFEV